MPALHRTGPSAGGGAIAAPRATTRRGLRRIRGDTLIAVLVLSPSLIAVLIFIYAFLLWTGYIALVNWNDVVPNYQFVGWRNFERLLNNQRYLIDLRNTLVFAFFFMGQCIGFGFLLAVLLDQRIKGEAILRTIYIFPFAISSIVTGVVWHWLMQPNTGINLILGAIGLGFLRNNWYADPNIGIIAVAIAAAWQMTGYTMALYLAGLRSIPTELREAAIVDGATGFQFYRHIAVPQLIPVTFTVLVILGNISLRLFDLTASMTSSGPAYADDTLAFHMFQTTFQQYKYSQGAAIAVTMLVLAILLVLPYLRSIRAEVER